MKIKLLAVLVIVVIVGYMYLKPKGNSVSQTEVMRIPIQIEQGSALKPFTEKSSYVFKNPATGDSLSIIGVRVQARNPGSSVYLGNNKIGDVDGIGILESSFSPSNEYFVFRSMSVCGANCEDYELYVVNAEQKKISVVRAPKTEKDANEKSKLGFGVSPYIEFHSWEGDVLKVTFFFTGTDVNANKFRISPKEVWGYDLASNQHYLIETLPE